MAQEPLRSNIFKSAISVSLYYCAQLLHPDTTIIFVGNTAGISTIKTRLGKKL